MDTLTITLTNPVLIDGWVEAANRNGTTPEALALEFLEHQGKSYSDLFKIASVTSAALFARFTPQEYATILAASQPSPDATEEEMVKAQTLSSLLGQLTEEERVSLNDPRVVSGLGLLVQAGLLDESRVPEVLAYDRPLPEVK
jgi:hypothetical protein